MWNHYVTSIMCGAAYILLLKVINLLLFVETESIYYIDMFTLWVSKSSKCSLINSAQFILMDQEKSAHDEIVNLPVQCICKTTHMAYTIKCIVWHSYCVRTE